MKNIFNINSKKGASGLEGALYGLLILGVFLVVVGFVLAFGADFMQTKAASYTANSYAANVTSQTLAAMTTVSAAQGTVSSVGILVIIVGLLIGVIGLLGFAGRKESY
jgi:uncharacterized membrane protein